LKKKTCTVCISTFICACLNPNKPLGLATLDGNNAKTNEDFDNLSKEIAKATPSGVNMNSFNPTNTAAASCPSVDDTWQVAATPLPPAVNAQLCSCVSGSAACSVADNVDEKNYKTLFDNICGQANGKYCTGINRNLTKAAYGTYGMCGPKDQLNFVMNAYYEGTGKKADSCSFKGSATLKANVAAATGSCAALASQAGKDGTGAVGAGPAVDASQSASKGAASDLSVSHVQLGFFGMGLYLLGAMASGAAMVLL
jgi:hypothetical protein